MEHDCHGETANHAETNALRREVALTELLEILPEARRAIAEQICQTVQAELPQDAVISGYFAHEPDGEPSLDALFDAILDERNGQTLCIPSYAPDRKPHVAFRRLVEGYQGSTRRNTLGVLELDESAEEIPASEVTHVLVPSAVYWKRGIVVPRNNGFFHVHRVLREHADDPKFWGLAFMQTKLDETAEHEQMDDVFTPSGKNPLIRGVDYR